jgi:hypothetical protein
MHREGKSGEASYCETYAAGLNGRERTSRELRQSFVSLLSEAKVPVEVISRLVGHRSTIVTETV